MNEVCRDVTDENFTETVLERSREIPVVVDLWAPWCGPCRQLAPLLEDIARKRSDEFELVKLNVDENPRVAAQLGARSIPLVVGFRDGVVAANFVGVQPASAINAFVDKIVPSEVDRLVAEAEQLLHAGSLDRAEEMLTAALQKDRRHEAALIMLARVLEADNRIEEALKVLSPVASTGHDAAAALEAQLHLKLAGDVDVGSLEEKLAQNPEDLDTALALGRARGARADYRAALDTLLFVVEENPTHADGAAKQAVLDIFNVLGTQDPLTREYRAKLSRLLF